MAVLENELQQLHDSFIQNMLVHSDSIGVLDARIHVLYRVMNDVLSGHVRTTPVSEEILSHEREHGPDSWPKGWARPRALNATIDFNWYLVQYWGALAFIEFVRGLVSGAKKEVPPEDENVVIFGG